MKYYLDAIVKQIKVSKSYFTIVLPAIIGLYALGTIMSIVMSTPSDIGLFIGTIAACLVSFFVLISMFLQPYLGFNNSVKMGNTRKGALVGTYGMQYFYLLILMGMLIGMLWLESTLVHKFTGAVVPLQASKFLTPLLLFVPLVPTAFFHAISAGVMRWGKYVFIITIFIAYIPTFTIFPNIRLLDDPEVNSFMVRVLREIRAFFEGFPMGILMTLIIVLTIGMLLFSIFSMRKQNVVD